MCVEGYNNGRYELCTHIHTHFVVLNVSQRTPNLEFECSRYDMLKVDWRRSEVDQPRAFEDSIHHKPKWNLKVTQDSTFEEPFMTLRM